MASRRMGWTRRAVLMGVLVGAGLLPGAAQDARADRCEPTELIVRPIMPGYEDPMDERDSPLCHVLLNYVYPRTCTNATTLMTCLGSVSPNPFVPVVVVPYNPNAGRVYCNYYLFVHNTIHQPASCQYRLSEAQMAALATEFGVTR